MKTINRISICTFTVILFATLFSCSKEEDVIDQQVGTIKAVACYINDPEETRTALGNKEGEIYPILWTSGDKIAVSAKTGSTKVEYNLSSSDGNRYGEFQTSSTAPVGEIFAYYPYENVTSISNDIYTVSIPTEQTYSANTFGPMSMPMYATAASVSEDLAFKPVLSTLKLQLKGTCQVKRIIVASETENLSGTATVDMNTGTISSFSTGIKYVQLNCTTPVQLNESTATLFHICLPANVSANSYKVYVVTSTNTVMVKSTTSTLFKKGVIKKMAELTFNPMKDPNDNSENAIMLGKTIWSIRNCGYSSTYQNGLLYQWGRKVGCGFGSTTQISTSGTTTTPVDNRFYNTGNVSPYDWRPSSNQLTAWTDDPCPQGWRVPTVDEYGDLCYSDYNSAKKYGTSKRGNLTGGGWNYTYDGSTIYFPASGSRAGTTGDFSQNPGTNGAAGTYFSSTTNGIYVFSLIVASGSGYSLTQRTWIDSNSRRHSGFAVRCVSTSSIQ